MQLNYFINQAAIAPPKNFACQTCNSSYTTYRRGNNEGNTMKRISRLLGLQRQAVKINAAYRAADICTETSAEFLEVCALFWSRMTAEQRQYAASAGTMIYHALVLRGVDKRRAWCRAMGHFRFMIMQG